MLDTYARFRRVPRRELRSGVEVLHPRFAAGPGTSLYAVESQAYYLGIARALARMRRQRAFDLVHAHFIYPDGAVAHRVARRYGVPFLVTEHAPWLPNWIERPGVRAEARAAATEAAYVVAVSNHVGDTIRAYTGEGAQVRVIPNGVDLGLFRPDPEVKRDPKQVLYVGQINFNKGIDILFEAIAKLAVGDPEIRVVLVGGAFFRNQTLQSEQLRLLPERLGIVDRVTFAGQLAQSEIVELMQQSAVLVLPSHAESFGAVLIEALACGTPVVATRCGGPEEIVTDAVGALVPPADPAALAAGIERVLDGRTPRLPERLRQYASEHFEIESVADRYAGLYSEILRR